MLKRWLVGERGSTSIEYAMVASLLAVVVVASVTQVSTNTNTVYNRIGSVFTRFVMPGQ